MNYFSLSIAFICMIVSCCYASSDKHGYTIYWMGLAILNVLFAILPLLTK